MPTAAERCSQRDHTDERDGEACGDDALPAAQRLQTCASNG
jgi:hypothetical protein